MMLLSTLLSLDHISHLLSFSFSSFVGAESLFAEFKSTFVFGNSEKLQASLFIRSKAHHFADDGFAKGLVFGNGATFAGLTVFVSIELGDFVAFVGAGDEGVGESHYFLKIYKLAVKLKEKWVYECSVFKV